MAFLDDLKKKAAQTVQAYANSAEGQKRLSEYNASNAKKSTVSSVKNTVQKTFQPITDLASKAMPKMESNWYKGSKPTQRETLARIYDIGNREPAKRESLMQMYQAELSDPTSPIYNPYTSATTTSLSKTNLNNTLKAQQEWEELTKELAWWAQHPSRNYSDDEIISRVDWNKYKTLQKMDAGRESGSPLALTDAVGYSKDAMYGVLWAARNPDQATGDYLLDAVQGVLGRGAQYKRDEKTANRLNPMSEEYNPYAVGSTMDELAYKHGVYSFDQEWLDNNRHMIANPDTNADYGKIYKAVQNTAKLNDEAKAFGDVLKRYEEAGLTPDIDSLLDQEEYGTLRKMQESLKSGQLLDTTAAIDFDPYVLQLDAATSSHAVNGNYTTDQYDQMLSDNMGGSYLPDAAKQNSEELRKLNTDVNLPEYIPIATEHELRAFKTTANAGYSDVVYTTADLITNGTGGAMQANAAQQKAAHAYANKNLFDAWDALNDEVGFADVLDEDEQAFLQKYFPEKYAAGELPTMDDFGLLDMAAVDPESGKTSMDVWQEWETMRGHAESVMADMADRKAAADTARQTVADVMDDLAEVYGEGTDQYNAAVATYEMAYAYTRGVPKVWRAYDAYQDASAEGPITAEYGSSVLTNQRGSNARDIRVLNALIENAEIMGLPEQYVKNMRQQAEDLKTQNDLLNAHKLQENEDYDQQVAAFDAQYQPYKPAWFSRPSHAEVVMHAVYDPESAIALGAAEKSDTVMLAMSMTPEERKNYKYKFMTEGEESATAYFDALSENLYVRSAEERSERTQEWASANEWNSALATVGSVAMTPLEGFSALATVVSKLQGNDINPYGPTFFFTQAKSDLRTGTKEGFAEAYGDNKVLTAIYNTFYDALTSAADSGISTLMGGKYGSMILGLSGFNSAVMDASMRGASDERAIIYGMVTAGVEAFTEHSQIDKMLGAFNAGATGVRGFVGELLNSMASEAGEEALSSILGTISDDVIMQSMSNREAAIEQYIATGLTREEAEAQASKDIMTDILYSGLVGGISGGATTSIGYAAGKVLGDNEQTAQTEPTEQPTGTPVQRAEAALSTAMQDGVGEVQQTATVAGVLQSFGLSGMEANAAAKNIVGATNIRALRKMLAQADDPAGLIQAIAMGSVSERSRGWAILHNARVDSKNAKEIGEQLISAYNEDMNDQSVMTEYDARVAFDAQADATAGIVSSSEPVDRSAVDAAKEQVSAAQQKLADAEAEATEAERATVAAGERFNQNPADEKAKTELKQAIAKQAQAQKSAALAEREASQAEKNFQKADADFKAKTEANMIAAREQAKADVQQRRAEWEAKKQEEAVAAEQKREADNVLALEADNFVNEYFAEADDDTKQKIRDRYIVYDGETRKVTRDMASFASQVSKKFNLSIKFTDSHGIFEGAYTGGNQIVLDKNATQGDVIKRVLVHEITHAAETSKTYEALAEAVLEAYYGDNQEQVDADIREKAKQYSETAGQNSEALARSELVAERLAEMLSGNQEAMNRLVAEKPDVATRIWRAIKEFIGKMTGVKNSELDKYIQLEKKLEKALNSRKKTGGTPVFSVVQTKDGTKYVVVDTEQNIFDGRDVSEYPKIAREYIKTRFRGTVVGEGDNRAYVDARTGNEYTNPANRRMSQEVFEAKMRSSTELDNLMKASVFEGHNPPTERHPEFPGGFDLYETVFSVSGQMFTGRLNIGIDAYHRRRLYDLTQIKSLDSGSWIKQHGGAAVQTSSQGFDTDILAQEPKKVNLSIPSDSGEPAAEVIRGGATKFSLTSWTEKEKDTVRDSLINSGYGPVDVDKWIDNVNSVAAIISNDKARLDYKADPDQVMLKNNQEYVKTLDASTLCAKRLLYQGTFNEIQHMLPNTVITSDMLLDLLNMMKDAGYETPCGVCYVESRRRHLGKFAEQWLHGRPKTKEQKAWEPYNGSYIPTLDELTTTDGLAKLKDEHYDTYKAFMGKMASLGSSNPKIVELRTDYQGEVRKLTKNQIEKIVKIGGLRVQSFSDFETPHLIDMMQAVLDMAGKKLTSQAYTKVPNFAWVFGDTGIKINLSLLAEGNGLDENGNLIFSSSEGMDFDEAMRLRDRYSQNVGTIIVGANDAHIKAAMADPRIDYIIPFHRSGWGQNELKKVGVLQTYTDYQATQNERMLDGSKPEGGNFYPIDYWDPNKSGDENAEIYLRLCEKDGRIPKFEQFLEKDSKGHWVAPSGYWKMLIDFKMYDNDGNYAPQQTVQPNFNMEEAVRVLNEYEGGANELPVAWDIVDRFVAEAKKNSAPGTRFSLPSTDILDQHIAAHQSQLIPTEGEPQQNYGSAQRQFTAQTLPNNPNIPQWAVDALQQNPEAMNYEPDSNREQAQRGWQRLQENGYEAEVERLLGLERYAPDDVAEANILMAMALREDTSDPATFFRLASDYAVKGTTAGQELQARKLFSKMTPNGIRVWVAGKLENSLGEYMRSHRPAVEKVNAAAEQVTEQIRSLQSGDELLRLTEGGDFTIDESNNRWGVLINEQQKALIDHYKLNDVARPGIFYNRATIKQRMLEAILATPNPLEVTNLGLNLIQRLEFMQDGQAVVTNADLNYIGSRLGEFIGYGGDEGGRDADVAIARAYEAFGNITPASAMEKYRTHRYVNMLLSIPSFTRNIMGNAAQNALNAVSHGGAVLLDKALSEKTHRRTVDFLDAQERIDGWKAFVEETKNTFRDYFIDKVNAAPNQDKYSTNRRARTFQNPLQEATKDLESFLMSVGDRNVWKKAFVNSLAEQQKLADRSLLFNDDGTTLTHDQMVDRAERDANYATFTEDNMVQHLVGDLARRSPVAADILSLFVPFTGVPTNIMKRSLQYSPAGFLTALGRVGYNHMRGQNFDQRAFVNDVSRAFTGSALMAAGYLLGAAGMIKMGSGDEDEGDKVYDAKTARGDQYTPYFYDPTTGTNVSMSTFAPAGSPLVWGASIAEALTGNEELSNIMLNALFSSTDSILNASYLSGLSDLFGGYGSISENIVQVGAENLVSQSIPALFTQAANALDPYVRDTKDKDFLVGLLKTTANRIPGLRNVVLPEKVTVTGETVPTRENRVSNFYDPFTRSTRNDNAALAEAMRLYEAVGTTDVLPSDAVRGKKNSFSLKIDGVQMSVTLTDEQKAEYRKHYGQLWTEALDILMADPAYSVMTDEEKAGRVKKIMQNALKQAKTEFLLKYGQPAEE